MKTQNRGFTLVEIMIVVVIIGLLASMAIPAFQKVRTNSQDKAVRTTRGSFLVPVTSTTSKTVSRHAV